MIRPYEARDVDRILEVWLAASLIAHPFLEDDFLDQEKQNIRKIYLPAAETWVWEDQGRVAGFVSLLENEVGAIFVDPDMHKRGIGRALMDKAVRLRGNLVVDVFKANKIGRAFYDRYGFVAAGEHVHDQTGHIVLRLEYSAAAN